MKLNKSNCLYLNTNQRAHIVSNCQYPYVNAAPKMAPKKCMEEAK